MFLCFNVLATIIKASSGVRSEQTFFFKASFFYFVWEHNKCYCSTSWLQFKYLLNVMFFVWEFHKFKDLFDFYCNIFSLKKKAFSFHILKNKCLLMKHNGSNEFKLATVIMAYFDCRPLHTVHVWACPHVARKIHNQPDRRNRYSTHWESMNLNLNNSILEYY